MLICVCIFVSMYGDMFAAPCQSFYWHIMLLCMDISICWLSTVFFVKLVVVKFGISSAINYVFHTIHTTFWKILFFFFFLILERLM